MFQQYFERFSFNNECADTKDTQITPQEWCTLLECLHNLSMYTVIISHKYNTFFPTVTQVKYFV